MVIGNSVELFVRYSRLFRKLLLVMLSEISSIEG